jgi:hypothetical protein
MNVARFSTGPSAPRRFLLLAEEVLASGGRRPRIRRYQLTCVGHGGGGKAVAAAPARTARVVGVQGRI